MIDHGVPIAYLTSHLDLVKSDHPDDNKGESMYGDYKAELILTAPDGYRFIPHMFSVPMSTQMRQVEAKLYDEYRVKEIRLLTQIANLESELATIKRLLEQSQEKAYKKWWKAKRNGR